MKVKYYPNSGDWMWDQEVSKILPYLDGRGCDIGCGLRSINDRVVRVDLDPKKNPDYVAAGEKLPFEDEYFDFVYGIHSFEHQSNPNKALREWLRVVKKGGIVAIVHPDVEFTKKQAEEQKNPGLQNDKYNRHFTEHTQESFLSWLSKRKRIGFDIVSSGVAMGSWSFFVILKKTK